MKFQGAGNLKSDRAYVYKNHFTGTQPHSLIYIEPLAAFAKMQWRSCLRPPGLSSARVSEGPVYNVNLTMPSLPPVICRSSSWSFSWPPNLSWYGSSLTVYFPRCNLWLGHVDPVPFSFCFCLMVPSMAERLSCPNPFPHLFVSDLSFKAPLGCLFPRGPSLTCLCNPVPTGIRRYPSSEFL